MTSTATRYYKVTQHKPEIKSWGVYVSRTFPDFSRSQLTAGLARDILSQCGLTTGWVSDMTYVMDGHSARVVSFRIYPNSSRRVETFFDFEPVDSFISTEYYGGE